MLAVLGWGFSFRAELSSLGRGQVLRALLGLLLPPPFFNPRTSCLVLTSCDTSPGSTTTALLSILAFLSYKTPTLGGLVFLFE